MSSFSSQDLNQLVRALQFATTKHRNQRRKDKDLSPYINHPISLLYVLNRMGGINDPKTLCAAVLHDTIEDTETTPKELEDNFGLDVADIVDEVSSDKSLSKEEQKRLQAVHAEHMSLPAKLIKIADKTCNLSDILLTPPAEWGAVDKEEYFESAKRVVDGTKKIDGETKDGAVNPQLEKLFDDVYSNKVPFQNFTNAAPHDGLSFLVEAIYFASVHHSFQRRKDAEASPYINHPVDLIHVLNVEAGVDDISVLSAAVLHDTVEDTGVTLDELEKKFGPNVRNYVAEVSDDKSLPKARRKELQIEHAPHASEGAKLVKLADKICNLRSILNSPPEDWTEERKDEYFEWAGKVVDGIRGSGCKHPAVPKLLKLFDAEYSKRMPGRAENHVLHEVRETLG